MTKKAALAVVLAATTVLSGATLPKSYIAGGTSSSSTSTISTRTDRLLPGGALSASSAVELWKSPEVESSGSRRRLQTDYGNIGYGDFFYEGVGECRAENSDERYHTSFSIPIVELVGQENLPTKCANACVSQPNTDLVAFELIENAFAGNKCRCLYRADRVGRDTPSSGASDLRVGTAVGFPDSAIQEFLLGFSCFIFFERNTGMPMFYESLPPYSVRSGSCARTADTLDAVVNLKCDFTVFPTPNSATKENYPITLQASDCAGDPPNTVSLYSHSVDMGVVTADINFVQEQLDFSNGPLTLDFCVTANLIPYSGSGDIFDTSVAFAKTKVTITFDVDGGFTSFAVDGNIDIEENTELSEQEETLGTETYTVAATQCDPKNNFEPYTSESPITQEDAVGICIEPNSDEISISSVESLTFEQDGNVAIDAVKDGASNPITIVTISDDNTKAMIESRLPSSFFDDDTVDVRATGRVQLETAQGGARRLSRSEGEGRRLQQKQVTTSDEITKDEASIQLIIRLDGREQNDGYDYNNIGNSKIVEEGNLGVPDGTFSSNSASPKKQLFGSSSINEQLVLGGVALFVGGMAFL